MRRHLIPAILVMALGGACAPTDLPRVVAVVPCSARNTQDLTCEGVGDPTCFEGSELGMCCPSSVTRDGFRHLDECVLALNIQTAQVAGDGTCTVADPRVPGLCETVPESGPISICLPTTSGRRCLRQSRTIEIRRPP